MHRPLPDDHHIHNGWQQRELLLELLSQEPRGSASRHSASIQQLIRELERDQPADLSASDQVRQLEGVWELRWSSSRLPYLAVGPWLENLQCLAPSKGRGMNLLRLNGPLSNLAAVAVEASIQIESQQRVEVRFQRGGWLGPRLGGNRLRLMRDVNQPYPAWLDITVLDDKLRVCRGNAGTVFALIRRADLCLENVLSG